MKFRIAENNNGQPAKWHSVDGKSAGQALKAWLIEEESVWDTDSSGSSNYLYATVDEAGEWRCFKVHHEWYWADWGTENRHVANEFTLKGATREEVKIPAERDWLTVRQTSFPETNKWPPKLDIREFASD